MLCWFILLLSGHGFAVSGVRVCGVAGMWGIVRVICRCILGLGQPMPVPAYSGMVSYRACWVLWGPQTPSSPKLACSHGFWQERAGSQGGRGPHPAARPNQAPIHNY